MRAHVARATLTGSGTRHKNGTRIGEASAAGNRVAWIEKRHASGERDHGGHRHQRPTRHRAPFRGSPPAHPKTATLHVLLTRQGDLAWATGTSGKDGGVVALERPGNPTRRLDNEAIEGFKLEDDRTLVWSDYYELYSLDLRASRVRTARTTRGAHESDRLIVTVARYPDGFTDGALDGVPRVRPQDRPRSRAGELGVRGERRARRHVRDR